MDAAVGNAVNTSMILNQAQTAQQAQMQIFRDALDNQQQQVAALMESATAGSGSESGSHLASEGHLGTQINTYA